MKHGNAFHNGIFPGTHGADTVVSSTRIRAQIMTGIIGLWFLAAFIGGVMNIFYQPGTPPVAVGLFLLVPLTGFTLAYVLGAEVRKVIDRIPLWLITISHVWRFVGIGFVVGAVIHALPPQFGYPEGFSDIVAALLCLPLAFAIRRGGVRQDCAGLSSRGTFTGSSTFFRRSRWACSILPAPSVH
jgi:predicted membrane channel-forming protein YqfA (hemolysin III family)